MGAGSFCGSQSGHPGFSFTFDEMGKGHFEKAVPPMV